MGNGDPVLAKHIADQESAWCGFEGVTDPLSCALQVSPFEENIFAIKGSTGMLFGWCMHGRDFWRV